MELKEFIGKVDISSETNQRLIIESITSPEIKVATEKPGSFGYPQHYVYRTINGDPISNGTLVFEDSSLTEPFKAAYSAYCRTKDAYYEEMGYWMRLD